MFDVVAAAPASVTRLCQAKTLYHPLTPGSRLRLLVFSMTRGFLTERERGGVRAEWGLISKTIKDKSDVIVDRDKSEHCSVWPCRFRVVTFGRYVGLFHGNGLDSAGRRGSAKSSAPNGAIPAGLRHVGFARARREATATGVEGRGGKSEGNWDRGRRGQTVYDLPEGIRSGQ